MKIKSIKIDSGQTQAWLAISDEDGSYLGTWHITEQSLVRAIVKERPTGLKFEGAKK